MEIREITAIEDEYHLPGSVPALGSAYERLLERWDNDLRDRETCLRLLFLSWYSCSEPVEFTGLPDDADRSTVVFNRTFDFLTETRPDDTELLFVVGYMARTFPYCCGEPAIWQARSRECFVRFRHLGGSVSPEQFEFRGAYGDYFAHAVRSGWVEEFMDTDDID